MAVRNEFKYLLSFEQYVGIRTAVKMYLPPDRFTQKLSSGYPITSLYYDTPNREYFYQKINGELKHIKIRIRSYSAGFLPESRYWLEEKIKIEDRQYKQRILLPEKQDIFEKGFLHKIKDEGIMREVYSHEISPSCFVFYRREAFEKTVEGKKLRITFDKDLVSYGMNQSIKDCRPIFIQGQDRNILMEIKYGDHQLPSFVKQMLKQYSLRRDYFSKYAMGLNRQFDYL